MKFYNSIEEIRADREEIREKIASDVTAQNMGEIICEAMEHYVGSLCAVMNPMIKGEIPFIMVALRMILTDLENNYKAACTVAKVIELVTESEHTTIEIAGGGDDDEG